MFKETWMIFQRIYFLDSADRFSAEFSQHLPSFGRFATSKKNALFGRITRDSGTPGLDRYDLRARATINRRHAEYTGRSPLVDAHLQSGGRNVR
jgi:hypothetical protein